jgi:hypothetical protein
MFTIQQKFGATCKCNEYTKKKPQFLFTYILDYPLARTHFINGITTDGHGISFHFAKVRPIRKLDHKIRLYIAVI